MFTNFFAKNISKAMLVVGFVLISTSIEAQCAMCRAVLESEEGGVKAAAINDGIVYLMAIPYILVGVVGYVIYKIRMKKSSSK